MRNLRTRVSCAAVIVVVLLLFMDKGFVYIHYVEILNLISMLLMLLLVLCMGRGRCLHAKPADESKLCCCYCCCFVVVHGQWICLRTFCLSI